jgi:hypothetical protein
MGYYMLFKHKPGPALDVPLGIHVRQENVNALCVFASAEAAAYARNVAGSDYYLEAVTPDDVVSLAALHGVDVVALDAYYAKSAKLIRAVDAVQALTSLQA